MGEKELRQAERDIVSKFQEKINRIADLERQLAEAQSENAAMKVNLTNYVRQFNAACKERDDERAAHAATREALGRAKDAIRTLNRQMGIEPVWGIGNCHHCLICHGTGSDELSINHGDDCPLVDDVSQQAVGEARGEDWHEIMQTLRGEHGPRARLASILLSMQAINWPIRRCITKEYSASQ